MLSQNCKTWRIVSKTDIHHLYDYFYVFTEHFYFYIFRLCIFVHGVLRKCFFCLVLLHFWYVYTDVAVAFFAVACSFFHYDLLAVASTDTIYTVSVAATKEFFVFSLSDAYKLSSYLKNIC